MQLLVICDLLPGQISCSAELNAESGPGLSMAHVQMDAETVEHESFSAYKYENATNCCHFHIY